MEHIAKLKPASPSPQQVSQDFNSFPSDQMDKIKSATSKGRDSTSPPPLSSQPSTLPVLPCSLCSSIGVAEADASVEHHTAEGWYHALTLLSFPRSPPRPVLMAQVCRGLEVHALWSKACSP
eukprot:768815-Hanusia_phi.AAC.2